MRADGIATVQEAVQEAVQDVRGTVLERWLAIPLFWRAQLIGWGLFSLVDLLSRLALYDDFGVAIAVTVVLEPVLMLLAAVMRSLYQRLGFNGQITWRVLLVATGLSFLASFIVVVVMNAVRKPFGWSIPNMDPIQEVLVPAFHYILIFGGWSLAYFWLIAELAVRAEHQRAVTAEAEALRTELQRLRLQLDPHFLFNALNGIGEEIASNSEAALKMLRDLTAFLRHSYAGIDQTVVPISSETEAIAAYLRVQEARFGARLRTRMEVAPDLADRPIASFLLQPLVENAVKYGYREPRLELGVRVCGDGDVVFVTVTNTGTLNQTATVRAQGDGVGLANLRRRLDLHYPGRSAFTLEQRPGTVPADGGAARPCVVAQLRLEGAPCSGS